MTKPKIKSIRFQLTAAYTAVLAASFALIGVGVWIALERSIEETADRELHSRLIEVRRYIDGFSPDDLMHQEEEFKEESLLSQSVANLRIYDLQGKWLFRTHSTDNWPPQKLDVATLSLGGNITTIRVGSDLIRILTAPVRVGVLQIGLSIDQFEQVKHGFLLLLVFGSPLLLVLAWLGGYWLSGRALTPVDEISKAASQISVQELSVRLPASGVGDELDRLSGVLNDMLARLESAFNRIAEFTADASHELRTPVAIIQTTSELMQTRPRTEDEHLRAWAKVTQETQRMSQLISDLLTLARMDSGSVDLELHATDLAEIARSAIEEMRVMADTVGIQLALEVALPPCMIRGDTEALRRVVCILLDNAIKFSTSPSVVRIVVENKGAALLTVSDSGPGIASDDLPLIFERFYRVSKDRSRKTGGSGLGLSIASRIVEAHGGKINVESTPGQGSTFTVRLPIR